MIMEKEAAYFEELTARYLSGEIDAAGVQELSAWVAENAENQEFFRQSQQAWSLAEEVRIADSLNLDDEWKNISKGSTKDDVRSTMYEVRSTDEELQADKKPLAVIRHISPFTVFLRVAAVIVLLAVPAFFLYLYLNKPAMQELTASAGRMETTLPDGSRITLNSGAVIRYPEKFKGKSRPVSLEGEAYFDVAHNAAKPFIISTDGIRVEVKGTSFYINTRALSGDFELVLTTGKVELYFENQQGQARVVMPGEKAVIHGSRITVAPNADANYMAWKTRRITFTNEPLFHVAATLGKVYQADIRIADPALAQCRLTASFDNQSLESVLNVLKATLDIDIRNSGSLVEISGKGCR